jgi:hypothetical protein
VCYSATSASSNFKQEAPLLAQSSHGVQSMRTNCSVCNRLFGNAAFDFHQPLENIPTKFNIDSLVIMTQSIHTQCKEVWMIQKRFARPKIGLKQQGILV